MWTFVNNFVVALIWISQKIFGYPKHVERRVIDDEADERIRHVLIFDGDVIQFDSTIALKQFVKAIPNDT